MARMRNWCSALFLVPLSLLTSHAASATTSTTTVAAAGHPVTSRALPAGIHAARHGRFTRDLCDHSKAHFCLTQVLLPASWTPDQPVPPHLYGGAGGPSGGGGGGSGFPGGMAPSDVIAAYSIPSNSAANGKIVAILDGPDSNAFSDLTEYRSQFGLPALPKCNGNPTGSLPACFAQVGEDGAASTGEDAGQDSDSETSLDMDMISAACPDCSILLVEIGNTSGQIGDSDFIAGSQTAASLGAVATSISIGGAESGSEGGSADPTGYTTPGHLVFAASGDFGYDLVDEGQGVQSPSYPASAPDVIAVGGTTLFSGNSYDEAVWNDGTFSTGQNGQDITTSGCSTEFNAPSWQMASLSGTSCSNRATADFSAAAAFEFQDQLVDIPVYQQGWTSVEGTSAASPLVAAIITRLGLAETISQNLAWPYTNASAFNDLGSSSYPVDPSGSSTDSSSPSSCGKLCSVATGWDGPSGLGTPNGTRLAALAGLAPPPPTPDAGTSSSSGGGSTTSSSSSSGTGSSQPGSGTGTSTPLSTSGGLGAFCTAKTDCESGICAEASAGQLPVCTQACETTATGLTCLIGFSCTDGYCFASTTTETGTGGSSSGSGASDDESGDSGSKGGCAVSRDGSAGWTGLGWLTLGLFAVGSRRRKSRLS